MLKSVNRKFENRKMTKFKIATTIEDLIAISSLAETIWHEYYTEINSYEQITYMVEKFQSVHALQDQINNSYEYYIINNNHAGKIGYFGFKPDKTALFLSKFYILKEFRGQGFGKSAFEFIKKEALKKGLKSIKLTVNKENASSIQFYQKSGFQIIDSVILDIGNGYVMDDYILEYNIN